MNLETYLKENYQKQIIDHAIRAEVSEDGTVSFYIHAHGNESDTLDFVVTANQLHPKYVIDDMKELAAANPIPPEILAKMDADRAAADSAND